MPKRITVVLDDDLNKKIHIKQAELIRKNAKSVSFSYVLNTLLKKSLR